MPPISKYIRVHSLRLQALEGIGELLGVGFQFDKH